MDAEMKLSEIILTGLVLPVVVKADNETSVYIRSFCLKCCKPDVMATTNYSHEGCIGPVALIHKRFQHSSAMHLSLAQKKVNEEVDKLATDPAYLNEMREKYKVTSST